MEQGTWRHERPIRKRIAILVYENCSFVDIGLILEAFDLANSAAATTRSEDPHYSVSILSREGGLVRCTSSVSIETSAFDGLTPSGYDALFIAGGKGASIAAKDSQTADWLERVLQTVPVMQAAGNGALLLKGANLAGARDRISDFLDAAFVRSADDECLHGGPDDDTRWVVGSRTLRL